MSRSSTRPIAGLVALVVFGVAAFVLASSSAWTSAERSTQFAATAPEPGDLWIVPRGAASGAGSALADAASLLGEEKAAEAHRVLAAASHNPLLAGYALLYRGRAELQLERHDAAGRTADELLRTGPAGYLREGALRLAADAAELRKDWASARRHLEALAPLEIRDRDRIYLRLGHAAREAREAEQARHWYLRLYHELPLAAAAVDAAKAVGALGSSLLPDSATWPQALERAERLYQGRRYAEARNAFTAVRALVPEGDGARIDLRIGQTEFHLKRYVEARSVLQRLLAGSPPAELLPEVRYYQLSTLRQLRREDEYIQHVHRLVNEFPGHPLGEAALNELGTHYILANEDGKAAATFADLYRRYPTGSFADRAAWKAGWWAYKQGEYAETIRIFESAATAMRRANYRPWWLYWAARSHAHRHDRDAAIASYRQTIADYRNSYYGREAARRVAEILWPGRSAGPPAVAPASLSLPPALDPGPAPPNADLVEALLVAGLYEDAVHELRAAGRALGTSSPRIEATIAYALHRQGQLRPAINTMRRAYPQFMAAGGEALPTEILTIIFPVAHWDLIRRHAAARRLDPFLVAALVAQESTFQADIRSPANAWGLMQIIPSTGRRYAQKLGIRPFSTWRLTDPETNVRIGTTYLAELLARFGDAAPALAAYNAGEHRVSRWLAERPGIERDEFVDDIPFPETQNYVKRVLGTAEDYRLLYGERGRATSDEPQQ